MVKWINSNYRMVDWFYGVFYYEEDVKKIIEGFPEWEEC